MNRAVNSQSFIIAIDGPAGSGKTTTAKLIADKLSFIYIDTGAMYRAVALAVLTHGLTIDDEESICSFLSQIEIAIQRVNGSQATLLNGDNVETQIRTPEMSKAASDVSKILCVRKAMVTLQRKTGIQSHGAVLEGRDIGTVVFPDAPLKIYLIASVEVRAMRRQMQLAESGTTVELQTLIDQINDRDRSDSTRENSPLQKAVDAIEIDTTRLTIDEQVEKILALAGIRMKVFEKEIV